MGASLAEWSAHPPKRAQQGGSLCDVGRIVRCPTWNCTPVTGHPSPATTSRYLAHIAPAELVKAMQARACICSSRGAGTGPPARRDRYRTLPDPGAAQPIPPAGRESTKPVADLRFRRAGRGLLARRQVTPRRPCLRRRTLLVEEDLSYRRRPEEAGVARQIPVAAGEVDVIRDDTPFRDEGAGARVLHR